MRSMIKILKKKNKRRRIQQKGDLCIKVLVEMGMLLLKKIREKVTESSSRLIIHPKWNQIILDDVIKGMHYAFIEIEPKKRYSKL